MKPRIVPSSSLWRFTLMALAVLGLHSSPSGYTQPTQPGTRTALVIAIQDAIGPATADFFVRALERADKEGHALLIVELDTPGGLDAAMRDMIQAILAAKTPVVTYVWPSGARAASAGTYILYASHVAAMAPATNLGAATPVSIAPQSGEPANSDEKQPDDKDKEAPSSASERKAVNDAVAYIRGLAELRGRNADWAESAVRSATSLSATSALAQNVIDLIAADIPDLLKQIDGRKVKMAGGELELRTAGLVVERVQLDWRTKLLAVITNPNVAYLLMLVGIYGLLLEGYNPGAIVPGVVGAISLLLALFAFQVLSVNYAGLALIILGVLLIVAEAFVPSFGALGLGGVAAFVFGSIILMDTETPGFAIAWQIIASVALVGAGLLFAIVMYFARSRRRPVTTGAEQLLQEPAMAVGDFEREGMVRVRGELWQATSTTPVKAGQKLRILSVHGLSLQVGPMDLSPPR